MKEFSINARSEFDTMKSIFAEMESVYEDLEAYFCFNKTEYPIACFMKDIKDFKDNFKVQTVHMTNTL